MSVVREIVVRGSAAGFAQTVEVGGFHFGADEPVEMGGGDQAPTPYDLLLAALGTCTSMTIGLYARKHGIPLEDITIRLTQERVHETDCAQCEDGDHYIHHMRLTIDLAGPLLTDEQRTRLRQIAARCPVHKTLTSKISIEVG